MRQPAAGLDLVLRLFDSLGLGPEAGTVGVRVVLRSAIFKHAWIVDLQPRYGWLDGSATEHLRSCGGYSRQDVREDDWYEFVSMGGPEDGHKFGLTLRGVSCACGQLQDRVLRWDASTYEVAAAVFQEYGATRVVEAWGDDVPDGKVTDYRRAVKAQDGENVVYSFIEWPSKQARDDGWAKVMADPRMQPTEEHKSVFDGQRMFWGGFEPIVDSAKSEMANA